MTSSAADDGVPLDGMVVSELVLALYRHLHEVARTRLAETTEESRFNPRCHAWALDRLQEIIETMKAMQGVNAGFDLDRIMVAVDLEPRPLVSDRDCYRG
jgi:hypothetical protein